MAREFVQIGDDHHLFRKAKGAQPQVSDSDGVAADRGKKAKKAAKKGEDDGGLRKRLRKSAKSSKRGH